MSAPKHKDRSEERSLLCVWCAGLDDVRTFLNNDTLNQRLNEIRSVRESVDQNYVRSAPPKYQPLRDLCDTVGLSETDTQWVERMLRGHANDDGPADDDARCGEVLDEHTSSYQNEQGEAA